MAELDVKQRVLVLIYTEYQKDIPDMKGTITATNLNISPDVFKIALHKLDNERYISGVRYARGGPGNKILSVFTDEIMMTRDGINYVEEKLDIQPTMSAREKAVEVSKRMANWGYNEFKDLISKVASELIAKATGLDK